MIPFKGKYSGLRDRMRQVFTVRDGACFSQRVACREQVDQVTQKVSPMRLRAANLPILLAVLMGAVSLGIGGCNMKNQANIQSPSFSPDGDVPVDVEKLR